MPAAGAARIAGTLTLTNDELVSTIAATDGTQLELESHGPAGDLFATMLSLPTTPIATPFGSTWVDPAGASLVVLDVYGPDRLQLFNTPLPPTTAGADRRAAAGALCHHRDCARRTIVGVDSIGRTIYRR